MAEPNNGQREIKASKSIAGKRTVVIPRAILPDVRDHPARYAAPGADGRVFIGAEGASAGKKERSKAQGARGGHAGLIGVPESDQGQAEE
ncbi:hypothetical protein [Streptomyces mirabilis]|uniref:hypothetical protein n=1 Tax=Streptomyces mirabilis TaxID=68239 RepID=UPI00343D5374